MLIEILVVGAGQIGSRHLQSLANLSSPVEIHVFDQSESALNLARDRYNEINSSSKIPHTVRYSTGDSYPSKADFVVVATSSKQRLSIIRSLVERVSMRYLLLEKVLFQRLSEYDTAEEILGSAQIDGIWVNCAARHQEFYAGLRAQMESADAGSLQWKGSQWGLGCNSIHALDAAQWVFRSEVDTISTASLDRKLVDSKRSGYREFTGTLLATLENGSTVELTSYDHSAQPLSVFANGPSLQSIWDMPASSVRSRTPGTEWRWTDTLLHQRLQSEMTAEVVESVMSGNGTILPTFAESSKLHRKLIGALLDHMIEIGESTDCGCPIT